MSQKQYSLGKQVAVAIALAIGTSGAALADESSMNPFTGDFYRELHGGQNIGNFYRELQGRRFADPSVTRAASAPAKDAPVDRARPVDRKVTLAGHVLTVTPTPIFTDKGA